MNKLYKYKIYCNTEQVWHFIWLDASAPSPTLCPVNTLHSVDLDSVSIDEVREPDMKSVEISSMPATASKILGDKKLFKRVHGIRADVTQGKNCIEWVAPYSWVKFIAIEFTEGLGAEWVELEIYDTSTGTYSTLPNFKLNQFGFAANVCKDYYKHQSEFDADLYQGMRIRIVYHAKASNNIGINFIMNEVK